MSCFVFLSFPWLTCPPATRFSVGIDGYVSAALPSSRRAPSTHPLVTGADDAEEAPAVAVIDLYPSAESERIVAGAKSAQHLTCAAHSLTFVHLLSLAGSLPFFGYALSLTPCVCSLPTAVERLLMVHAHLSS